MSEENKFEGNDNEKEFQSNKEAYEGYTEYTEHVPIDIDEVTEKKSPRRISVKTFVISMIALFVATVMLTFSVSQAIYRINNARLAASGLLAGADEQMPLDELELLDLLFQNYSYYDLDEDELITAVLKAYADATGDRYAEYYTAQEYAALVADSAGNTKGIGVTVIESTLTLGAKQYDVIKIVSVIPDSPAEEAGVKVGDLIFCIGTELKAENTVDSLGFTNAVNTLKGETGTQAQFLSYRRNASGVYELLEPFSVTRRQVEYETVTGRACATDQSVGIVKITQFNLKTPKQFCAAVDSLKNSGCTRFVFDVRYNGGGDLRSIVAVLSYFLNEGDTIISTSDRAGNRSVIKAQPVSDLAGDAADCNVSRADIGKYRDLDVVILCNESTASAAELFVATFRDYALAKVVGTTTYGKGSMQTIMSLAYFGYEGAVKLTTNMYFPPCGESYEGIGIAPDPGCEVELSEKAANTNIYELSDADDNQLQKAIETFN